MDVRQGALDNGLCQWTMDNCGVIEFANSITIFGDVVARVSLCGAWRFDT